jgi:hypothetical protein
MRRNPWRESFLKKKMKRLNIKKFQKRRFLDLTFKQKKFLKNPKKISNYF